MVAMKKKKMDGNNNEKIEKIIGTIIGIIITSVLVVYAMRPFVESMNSQKNNDNEENANIQPNTESISNKKTFNMGFSVTSWDAVNMMQSDFDETMIDHAELDDIKLSKERYALIDSENTLWTILSTINQSHSFTFNDNEYKNESAENIKNLIENNLSPVQGAGIQREEYSAEIVFNFSDFTLSYDITYRYADEKENKLYKTNDKSILIGIIINASAKSDTSDNFKIVMSDNTYWTINPYFSITTTYHSYNEKTETEGVVLDESKLDNSSASDDIKDLVGIWTSNDEVQATYYFYNDKTGYYELKDITTYKISYDIEDGNLLIAYLADDQTDSNDKIRFTYRIENDNLIIESGGTETTFNRVN